MRRNPYINDDRKDDDRLIMQYLMQAHSKAYHGANASKVVATFEVRDLIVDVLHSKSWEGAKQWMWLVYTARGEMPVGGGTFIALPAGYAEAGVAGIRSTGQGRGVYTQVLRELARIVTCPKGLVSSTNMSEGSIKAWERAGAREIILPGEDTSRYHLSRKRQ